MNSYQSEILYTGNEYVSIPRINLKDCGIQSIGFVSESLRGCVEMQGNSESGLVTPFVEINANNLLAGKNIKPSMQNYWVPTFETANDQIKASYTIVAPIDRRGFTAILEIRNNCDEDVELNAGWRGLWCRSSIAAGQPKEMHALKTVKVGKGDCDAVILEYVGQAPLFALSLMSDDCPYKIVSTSSETISYCDSYSMESHFTLVPGETKTLSVYAGIGLEEISASASAREQFLHGSKKILENTRDWLYEHTIECSDMQIKRVINLNSFYNYFYCQAMTLDTEEFVVMTSRNSDNDSCGIYRDRDAMRWSLPAVLQISWANARRMLIYALTKQLNNIGMRSRFINGIAMEPGFQLDQLCAPIRALDTYVDMTNDLSLLFDRRVQTGINRVLQILGDQRHSSEALFETLYRPSGEYARLPYLCYSNVLVCRILEDIAILYNRIRDMDRADENSALARKIKGSILNNFIKDGPYGEMYVHSIDLKGDYELGDDVDGSLLLLSYLKFCKPDDPAYLNTVKWIYSDHNPNRALQDRFCTSNDSARYSIIGAVNELLTVSSNDDLVNFLCDSVEDGEVSENYIVRGDNNLSNAGIHASCAGYLAYGLGKMTKGSSPSSAEVVDKKKGSPNEALYHPPPKLNMQTRKARL